MATPSDAAPPVGTAQTLEPLVRRVLADNPSAFTYHGTQTYLVGTADELVVIDPGPDDPDHINAVAAAIGKARVVAISCTHTHRDHSPASRPLAELKRCPVIGCAPLSLPSLGPRSDAPFDADYAPDQVLADGECLRGEGWTLTAVATPGHTSNHLCYALDGTGVLFTGDHVMGWSTTVVSPPDGNMADYMKSMELLHERDDRVYYPAHGPAVEKPRQLVRGMIGHRRQRERQILKCLAEGPATIPAMVAKMYVGLDSRLVWAAGQSVLAHLIDLEHRDLAERTEEAWAAVKQADCPGQGASLQPAAGVKNLPPEAALYRRFRNGNGDR